MLPEDLDATRFYQLPLYRAAYVLSTINPKTRRKKATHVVYCIAMGRYPTWGVWTIGGRFVRYCPGRAEVVKAYPNLVWDRWMSLFRLADMQNLSVEERRAAIERQLGAKFPDIPHEEPPKVRLVHG